MSRHVCYVLRIERASAWIDIFLVLAQKPLLQVAGWWQKNEQGKDFQDAGQAFEDSAHRPAN
jgi:hypothetical protein